MRKQPGRERELVWLPADMLTMDAREGEVDETYIGELAASINRSGMLHPIVIGDRKDCRIVAGRCRLLAARRAGWPRVPVLVADDLSTPAKQLRAQLDENELRRPLSPSERIAILEKLRPLEEAAARQRQRASRARAGQKVGDKPKAKAAPGGAKLASPSASSPATAKGKTREVLGQMVGTSAETVRKLEAIGQAAKEDPAKYGDLPDLADKRSTDAAYRELERRRAHEKRLAEGQPGKSARERIIVPESEESESTTFPVPQEMVTSAWDICHALEAMADQLKKQLQKESRSLTNLWEPISRSHRALRWLFDKILKNQRKERKPCEHDSPASSSG